MPTDDLDAAVERWIGGWTRSRRVAPADRLAGAFRVFLDQPERRFEFVTAAPDAEPHIIRSAAGLAGDTPGRNWVSVFTRRPDAAIETLRAEGLAVERDTEWLMTIALADQPSIVVPRAYELSVRDEGDAAAVTIVAQDGAIAATGRVGVDGRNAVPDRIVTGLDHRRKGLGSAVMSALATESLRRGAASGILTASPEGQRLYSRLGWSPVARLVIGRT